MRLILVRHGQTDWNKEYRVQGHRDLSLNEFGMAQAEAISKALQSETVEAIYSSPLLRAYQVAQAINQTHQVDITSVSKLKELDVGETDGLHYPELGTLYPDFFKLWTDDAAAAQFPGGESLPELQGRVWEAVENIIAANHLKSVVITSHFFALLTLLCKVLDLGLSDFRRLNLSVASISVVELYEGQGKLVSFNDTCHLGMGNP